MNEKKPQSPSEVQNLAIAWEWVLRLRDDDASQEDLAEWLEWYESDERNKQAFEEMQALWRETGRVTEGPRGLSIQQMLGPPKHAASASLPRASFLESLGFSSRRFVWAGATLAAVACALVLGLRWMAERERTIVAAAGPAVVREAVLPDGSSVELAARSAIAVQYTEKERVLEMKGGEAYFSVTRNPERPFIVKVGELRVHAVGTAFNIRRADERVVVTVTEGTVDIYPPHRLNADDARQALRVTAGNQLIWSKDDPMPVLAAVESERALAWRQGRLEYLNEPLSAVIADINRYAQHPAVIGDEAVGEIIFSGTVFTDATEVWLHALPNVFPVEVESQSDGSVVILGPRLSDQAR